MISVGLLKEIGCRPIVFFNRKGHDGARRCPFYVEQICRKNIGQMKSSRTCFFDSKEVKSGDS